MLQSITMARIKLGQLVVGIRGTVGGVTYSANASGPHVRLWSKGPNAQTAIRAENLGRISGLGALWLSMTDGERADWTTFGLTPPEVDTNSLGELYYLTGWQWFCRVNRRLQSVGLATTTTLPTSSGVSAPPTATITASALPAGTVVVSWTGTPFPAGHSGLAYIGFHPTTGLAALTVGLKQLWAAHEPAGSSVDVTAAALARFGAVQATWKAFLRLHALRDDGVRSPATIASCEVS